MALRKYLEQGNRKEARFWRRCEADRREDSENVLDLLFCFCFFFLASFYMILSTCSQRNTISYIYTYTSSLSLYLTLTFFFISGEMSVGKSSLVLQFVRGHFDPKHETTIGGSF